MFKLKHTNESEQKWKVFLRPHRSYLRAYLASFSSSQAVFPPPKFFLAVLSKPYKTGKSSSDQLGSSGRAGSVDSFVPDLNEALGEFPAGLARRRLDVAHGEEHESRQERPGSPHRPSGLIKDNRGYYC